MSNFTRDPADPIGLGQDAIWHRQTKKYNAGNKLRSVKGAKMIPDPRGGYHLVIPKAKPGGPPGAGGWDWAYPTHKELDTTLSYPQGKFVYISAMNTLVTAGMTDIISNANVISCQGLWQANRAVPAATGGAFNVPVFPYAGFGTTVPSGTPLMGDLDGLDGSGQPAIYWIFWGEVNC